MLAAGRLREGWLKKQLARGDLTAVTGTGSILPDSSVLLGMPTSLLLRYADMGTEAQMQTALFPYQLFCSF